MSPGHPQDCIASCLYFFALSLVSVHFPFFVSNLKSSRDVNNRKILNFFLKIKVEIIIRKKSSDGRDLCFICK